MKCPLKEDNFGRMPECQPDCAWLVNGVCAVAARYDVYSNDEKQPENDVSAVGVDANDSLMDLDSCTHGMRTFASETDSREKLEADARSLQTRIWQAGANSDGISLSHIIELLNRQAAITKRETEKKWSCFSDSADGHIAELTNQLESAHAKNRALKAHIAKMQEGRHGWHIKGKELQRQVDTMRDVIREFRDERDHYIELFHEQERRANELQSRDANLVREIGTLRAERDRYRELCSKLLDAADDMRRVRDAYDQFGKVDR